MSVVVSDTSPIRVLSHLGRMELLQSVFGKVFVPPAVIAELAKTSKRLPALDVRAWDFVRVEVPQDRPAVEKLLDSLDPGEAEAIVLATELHADAILIDEKAGRLIAKDRGLRVVGVLGLLVRAKQLGMVPSVDALIVRLQDELGFFISEQLRREILLLAGERPQS